MVRASKLRAVIGGFAVIAGTCLAVIAAGQGPASAQSAKPAVSESPNPGRENFLQAVKALSPSNAWAVGYYCSASCGKFGEVDRSLILHWNGVRWSKVRSPNPGTQNNLSGVEAVSARDAWAVGTTLNPVKGMRPLFLHWNGKTWSNDSPVLANVVDVSAVSAISATEAWAVGSQINVRTGAFGTLIMRWNGKHWSKVSSPSPSKRANLYGVSASSPTNAWAVGGYCVTHCSPSQPPVDHSLIMHWNGKTWSRVPSPSVSGADLHSVDILSRTNAWAAGFGTFANLMLHWNGSKWSRVKFSTINLNPVFSVTFSAPADGWAVGFGDFTRWNGTKWSPVPVSTPPDSNLQGTSADSHDDAWAVGFLCAAKCGTQSVIWDTEAFHWNGTSWSRK